MVWCHLERKTSRYHSITHVDGGGERLSPEPLVHAFVVKHRPHKVHECAVHALGHPILLRSIRDGQLVLDAVVGQVLLEVVGQVFASVVSAQHFDLFRARARVALMKQQTL